MALTRLIQNDTFYPTPSALAFKMVSKIDVKFSDYILEPSAGKGDLADKIKTRYNHYNTKIDCIEIEPDLQATLIGKGFNVIDSDFLKYSGQKQYDTIIMNPPFSNGVHHVLKAWDMIYNGDVIALLNAETIRNSYSKERILLNQIIEKHGEVEFIENAFLDADRKTGVEVALIHLRKRNDIKHDYFQGMDSGKEHEFEGFQGNSIAIPESQINNFVKAYNKAIECEKESILKSEEASYYASLIGVNHSSDNDCTIHAKERLNKYIDNLRESAWRNVMNMADFRKHLTEKVLKQIEKDIEIVKKLEFTVDNINKFLMNLIQNQGDIINDCLVEMFDELTKYHEENRVYLEGWKSNNYFLVNKRVVLPYITRPSWSNGIEIRWEAKRKIEDLDKIMKFLSGGKDPEVSLMDAIEANKGLVGLKIESTYFSARFYKKGTGHIYFKDKKLLDRFNLIVGRQKKWLPASDELVPKEFWIVNS